jgi:hypothetical protein
MLTQAANLLDEQKATIDALNKVVEAAKELKLHHPIRSLVGINLTPLFEALAELQDNEL